MKFPRLRRGDAGQVLAMHALTLQDSTCVVSDSDSAKYLYKSITYERYLDLHTQPHTIKMMVALISGSIGLRHA